MSDSTDLEASALRAKLARERLLGTAHEIQSRLEPARLFDDAVTGVKAGAVDAADLAGEIVRRKPGAVAGGAALLLAVFARRPLWRLGRKLRGKATD